MDLTSTDSIRLTVPATAAAVRIARAGAAGLATRAGFTYREVEQLQLAVGEAAALLTADPDGEGTVALAFDVQPDGLLIDLRVVGSDLGSAEPLASAVPGIAAAVLDAAVDEWHVHDGGRRVILTKRLSETHEDEDEDD